MHKSLLAFHFEYLRKALQGSWKKAQEGVVTLQDIEPRVLLRCAICPMDTTLTCSVSLFVHWIYTQPIPSHKDIDRLTEPYEPDGIFFWIFIKSYVFGERFLALGFQRAIHEALEENLGELSVGTPPAFKQFSTP